MAPVSTHLSRSILSQNARNLPAAALSEEAMQTVKGGMVENVAAVLSGHWPRPEHIVNSGVEPKAHLAVFDPALFENTGDRLL